MLVSAIGLDATMRKIALGLDVFLDPFAFAYAAETWKQFSPDPMHWQSDFLTVMNDPNTEILFNLKGVNVWEGVTRAAAGRGGPTDWELLQIQQDRSWWPRITWILDGAEQANPFE